MIKRRPFQTGRPLEWAKKFGVATAERPIIEGTVERLAGRSARAERRIAAFIAKNQIDGEQNWEAKWISFQAIAQYCAELRLPRLDSAAGEAGKKFAYNKLVEGVERGYFNVSDRCRVLLLVSHGGKIFTIKPSELLEAREAFDPDIFTSGYLNRCWARAGLVSKWFFRNGIPSPWRSKAKRILRMGRGRSYGGRSTPAQDIEVIDRALEILSKQEVKSIRKAIAAAIAELAPEKHNIWDSETDRLRTKMRKRQRLRGKNKRRLRRR